MKPSNKAFLDEHLPIFANWERNQTLKTGAFVRDEMLRVMMEEFNPKYNFCAGCPYDLGILVSNLFIYYHNWLKAQHNDKKIYKDVTEGIEEMNKLPIIVHANFPKHGE